MRFDSTNAKHKLFIVALLLGLFAIPFAASWQSLGLEESKAVIAGGAVIGSSAAQGSDTVEPTNDAGQAADAAGHSFVGDLAR